jgi:hypothetical protein
MKQAQKISHRSTGLAVSVAVVATLAVGAPTAWAGQVPPDGPLLSPRVSRWQGDALKKVKGPEGFDLEFLLVGPRFDGAFRLEGVPPKVLAGEAIDIQLELLNIGTRDIRVASVLVTGDGLSLDTEVLASRIDPKSAATLATFTVPPQSSAGSTFLITVVMTNGDKHRASLTFLRP